MKNNDTKYEVETCQEIIDLSNDTFSGTIPTTSHESDDRSSEEEKRQYTYQKLSENHLKAYNWVMLNSSMRNWK